MNTVQVLILMKHEHEAGKELSPVYRFLSDHLSQKLCSSRPSWPPDLWTHLRKLNVSVKLHPGLSPWKCKAQCLHI